MKISIITVCYNSVATLATAIESVLDQTYPDIEYIVVDGGSKDGTVELLGKYAEERSKVLKCESSKVLKSEESSKVLKCEPASLEATPCQGSSKVLKSEERVLTTKNTESTENIQHSTSNIEHRINNFSTLELSNFRTALIWISEPDQGMYDAINKGVRLATGDVIGILNADDFLADDGVVERIANTFLTTKNTASLRQKATAARKNAEIDVVYGDVRFVRTPRQGAADPSECANGEVAQVSTNELTNYRTNALASLRSAKTLRYYSAKRWKPWMLQWGFMPPHPGVYIRRELFEKLGYYKLGYHIAADYELLIRYLRKGKLNMRYLDTCIVGMRPGGKSTKSWRSNVLLNQEIVRGNRENGYFCFMLMLAPKYVFKIFEFIVPWAKGKMRS